ncbi:hypothetical protein GZH47_33285 (plasmid) [Paenibacillus rhizovicinus]|uniref:Uncharacterized protein n=1 Tax=Paenibacillus rhizovicinus TaxID=2704463 RepID=A0A6C0PBF2_9BACL|nr:hypothetical protein [Paenibacillus rhizovicinus]QHW35769.1 hypothetical protein GZH47_33285 [Paenibacillus rhizovicinus]
MTTSEVRFCFRIKAEAEMAHDLDTGELVPLYSQLKMDLPEVPPADRYTEMHQNFAEKVAGIAKKPVEMFELITPEEYDRNVGWES